MIILNLYLLKGYYLRMILILVKFVGGCNCEVMIKIFWESMNT